MSSGCPPKSMEKYGLEFQKIKSGTTFELKRPSFKAGTITINKFNNVILPKNNRAGLGNYDITRTSNFIKPPIRARNAIDFDKLQAIDIETQGAKIQLSDKTIEKLFHTKLPDPSDKLWIDERNRMVAIFQLQGLTPEEIEIRLNENKPLGREQRKIAGNQNIGQSNLNLSDKLTALIKEVNDGRAESRAQQGVLVGYFANVLADTNSINTLTNLQLTELSKSLIRIAVPDDYRGLGLSSRFVDIDYYRQNEGLINLLLFAKVGKSRQTSNYNFKNLVKNYSAGPINGLPGITLTSLNRNLIDIPNRKYLDLERGGQINLTQLRNFAGQTLNGFDNPEFSIDKSRR